eukprot:scaffold214_cov249-Pinguiococcus_pyrenoidosus.AAC.6
MRLAPFAAALRRLAARRQPLWSAAAAAEQLRVARGGVRGFHASAALSSGKRDYYEVLGLPRNADKKDIKKKYFEMAKKLHPDANRNDPDTARNAGDRRRDPQEAKEAYEVLSNDEQRQVYDAYGHAGVDAARQGGGPDVGEGFDGMPFQGFHFDMRSGNIQDFERLFEEFESVFGGGSGRRRRASNRPYKGEDVQTILTIDFFDAVKGCKHTVKVPFIDGNRQTEKEVTTEIPAGVYDGATLRVPGQGLPGHNGGESGDLFVRVRVKPDDYFRREDDDIFTELPVSLSQAVLGELNRWTNTLQGGTQRLTFAELCNSMQCNSMQCNAGGTAEVLTLDGMVELKIPEGTQTGTRLVLRDRGVPRLHRRGRGHHYVQVMVQIPKPSELSSRQIELMEEFNEEEVNNSYSWFERWSRMISKSLESLKQGAKM